MRLRPRFVLVVKAHCAVGSKVISVACFSWMAALNAIHPAARNHFALSVNDKINFLGYFVVMREVCSARRKVHPEQTGHNVSLIDRVSLCSAWTCEKLVQNRGGMSFHRSTGVDNSSISSC